jgi:hypothetical protein
LFGARGERYDYFMHLVCAGRIGRVSWRRFGLPGTAAIFMALSWSSGRALADEAGHSAPVEAPAPTIELPPPIDEDLASQEEGPPTQFTWYGWQMMLADALSLTLAVNLSSPWIGLGGYLLLPAGIQLAHGQAWRAGVGVLIRLAVPAAFLGLGAWAAGGCKTEDEPAICSGALVGGMFAIGVLVAALGDDAGLGWKITYPEPKPTHRSGAPGALAFGIVPYRQGAGLRVAARF